MSLTNAQLIELCARAAGEEPEERKSKALRRAARNALTWPEEAAAIREAGRSLTELWSVGPYVARILNGWLDEPPEVPDPPPLRQGFITLAHARAVLATDPGRMPRADLQMHTTDSDGTATLEEMVDACRRYEFIAITDHTKGLKIAGGMDEAGFARQAALIDRINERGDRPRVLKAMEMNIDPLGEGDMEPETLARMELVLGAFHSKLRLTEDQTERYVAALRNPTIDVLAHPRGRMFNFRAGLTAEWDKVFEVAAEEGVALEIDCTPFRQDLNVELLKVAREYDVMFSLGTDSHSVEELEFVDIGVAATILAGIDPKRVLSFLPLGALPRRAGRPALS